MNQIQGCTKDKNAKEKFQKQKFRLDRWTTASKWAYKHWHGLPGKDVDSLSLEVFITCVGIALSFEDEVELNDLQSFLQTYSYCTRICDSKNDGK